VNAGTDHDTAAFAVESIRRWWNDAGRPAYPGARRLLITADSGGTGQHRVHGRMSLADQRWPQALGRRAPAGPPKAEAGASASPRRRRCRLDHLDRYAQPGPDGLVFTGPRGALLRRSNFRRRVWLPALGKGGLPEIHFHDLRHTGNILTATAGASLRELMARMGHTSTRAALVYLHDTDDRQRIIAAAISDLAGQRLGQLALPETSPEKGSGT
jgi:hypothetical protein